MIIGVLTLLGYALIINHLAKWRIESSLLYICCTLACILYMAGLIGFLMEAIFFIWGVGLFLLLIGIKLINKNFYNNVGQGVIFFLFSVIGLWGLTSSEYYSNFIFVDDFSHWGRSTKIITENDRFLISNDSAWYQDYPPGLALFNYIFTRASGFSPSHAMFSQGIFILAAFTFIFSLLPNRINKYAFIGIALFIYTLIFFHGSGFHTLSADLILGVVFGFGLLGFFKNETNNKLTKIIQLIPIVIFLPLIKPTGIIFSAVVIGVVLIDTIVAIRISKKMAIMIAATVLLALLSILTYKSWSKHTENQGLKKTLEMQLSIIDISKAFSSSQSTERQKTTIENFKKRVFFPHPEAKVTRQYYWLLVCIFLICLYKKIEEDNSNKNIFFSLAVLFFGFCSYLAILLLSYLFFFGNYEGPRLASFDRYVNTYLVGIVIILFGLVISSYFKRKCNKTITAFLVIVTIMIALPNIKGIYNNFSNVIKNKQDSSIEDVSKNWDFINKNTPTNSKVYFIWQGGDGTENTIFNYGIMPRETNQGCWSIGELYSSGDVWTCKLSIKEFENKFQDYDYIFIGKSDNNINYYFIKLFGIKNIPNGSLFKIIKENGKNKLINIM